MLDFEVVYDKQKFNNFKNRVLFMARDRNYPRELDHIKDYFKKYDYIGQEFNGRLSVEPISWGFMQSYASEGNYQHRREKLQRKHLRLGYFARIDYRTNHLKVNFKMDKTGAQSLIIQFIIFLIISLFLTSTLGFKALVISSIPILISLLRLLIFKVKLSIRLK